MSQNERQSEQLGNLTLLFSPSFLQSFTIVSLYQTESMYEYRWIIIFFNTGSLSIYWNTPQKGHQSAT